MNQTGRTVVSAVLLLSPLIGGDRAEQGTASSPDANAPQGQRVFTDYRGEKPAAVHKITPADLPPPYATRSVDRGPDLVRRPVGVAVAKDGSLFVTDDGSNSLWRVSYVGH